VASTPYGLVVAGRQQDQLAVWLSSDGITWADAEVEGAAEQDQGIIFRVLTVGPNVFALGERRGPSGQERPIWLSHDGLSWDLVTLDPTVFAPYPEPEGPGPGMRSPSIGLIYAVGDQLVATGEATWIWSG
jgi:hypothetical protein